MSTTTATVHDITPGQFRRRAPGHTETGQVEQRHSLFSDMADGTYVAQLFLNFAGFEWKETKFFTLIIALCGEGGRFVEMYDEGLAEQARCTDRTIRAWRRNYLDRMRTIRCSLLTIMEGPYNPEYQRYERTRYSIPLHVAELIGQAVAVARAMPEYGKDRLAALGKAAGDAYDEIPDAPPPMHRRKPKKSSRSPVMQSLSNADKNLRKGRKALDDMPGRMRAALLAGEGENLRELLFSMRGEIDEILSGMSEDVEAKAVNDMPEISSGIPLASIEDTVAEGHFRVREDIKNTRKRPDEQEPEIEHTPEAVSAWGDLEDRLTKPQTQTVEVELVAELPPDEPDPDEIAERAAILEFDGRIEREEAEALARSDEREVLRE
jgi:hypothetical protein